MHVVIFEGSRWPAFAPLSLSRPVFSLACGASTLLEKQIRALAPTRLSLWVRPGLVEYCRLHVLPKLDFDVAINQPLDDEPALLVAGRALHLSAYEYPPHPAVVLDEYDHVSSALVHHPGLSPRDILLRTDAWRRTLDLPRVRSGCRTASYLWDLLAWNEEAIAADAALRPDNMNPREAGPYHLIQGDDVYLAADTKLGPGCVLDASKGPILLDAGVSVGANAVIQGPCWVGHGSQIAPLAALKPGVSIGPMCKVGGEVGSSILLGYSNKGHDGYLGDSYLGEWVNFGAGTTTSNLKNTYGEITLQVGEREIPTGRRFLGSLVGDHTKTAIGTRLMTGTYLGYCSMLATSALPPRFVPSFSFRTDKGASQYEAAKAKEVMAAVFARRHRQWTEDDAAMVEYVATTAGDVEGA